MKTEISVIKNPVGYNKGFFGYVITRGDRKWTDGGYNTAAEAKAAASHKRRRMRAER